MSGVFQLRGTLRNKPRCTLRHLRQQLRHSLRASEIRLRRTIRTDFLLRVPALPKIGCLTIFVLTHVAEKARNIPRHGMDDVGVQYAIHTTRTRYSGIYVSWE